MNQKIISSTLAGLLTSLLPTISQAEVYMCQTCPAGYSCSKGLKTACPSDSICPPGVSTPIKKSSCKKVLVVKLTSGSGQYILNTGTYEVEVAGTGGGGSTTLLLAGCNGGSGALITSKTFTINYNKLLTYSVGAGGSPNKDMINAASNGGTSSFSIKIDNETISASAKGGDGGPIELKSECTSHGKSYGNGGAGGLGKTKLYPMGPTDGGSGWVTIYQYIC